MEASSGRLAHGRATVYDSRLLKPAVDEIPRGTLLRLEDAERLADRVAVVIGALWAVLEESGFSSDDLWQRIGELNAADNRPS